MRAKHPVVALLVSALLAVACSAPRPSARARIEGDPPVAVAEPKGMQPGDLALGVEVRAYPSGVIPALYGEHALSAHGALTFDLGANHTDRGDDGEHDREDGSGFGGGLGYRHYFGEHFDRWFVGARVDLWSLAIDWEDQPGTPMMASGESDVLVLQPTVEAGYAFLLGARWRLNVFVAAGAEINLDTDGEDVGEGAIGLLGVSILYTL